ncbi:primosomal protein n [Lasius niger]|uniref:DNA 3'-5' helicase n=1 Tax=Lasius niger TaxID=67767 RepID=A0A0J7KQK7_LASNI|nr:primosomal protein n [Lasius niger]
MKKDIALSLTEKEDDLGHRIHVLLRRPFESALEYRYAVPLPPGSFVRVPLGKKEAIGCVWDQNSDVPQELAPAVPKSWPMKKLRAISAPLDFPALPLPLRRFVNWASAYYLMPPGMMLGPVIRMVEFLVENGKGAEKMGWQHTKNAVPEDFKMTKQRQAVLEALSLGEILSTDNLSEKAGVGVSVLKKLEEAGLLAKVPLPSLERNLLDPHFSQPKLSPEQAEAGDFLREMVKKSEFQANLLQGITGSGKTEIYFEAIAQALEDHKQVLVLLPEIALTAQWKKRFEARFGTAPLVWHSELTPRARSKVFEQALSDKPCLIVGARSALFLPFSHLGLIVIDEEHEATFKQEEGVIYHGRDMGILRANLEKCPVILASATPSLETLTNAQAGRYHWQKITERYGEAVPPSIEMIDLKALPPEKGDFLSPKLIEEVKATLARGEQALLFLNRRGYAPLTLCQKCGFRFRCDCCSAWLVQHQHRSRMQCHHCDHVTPAPSACPECGSEEDLAAIGPGVERIAEEAMRHFPEAHQLCLTSDLTSSQTQMQEMVRKIEAGEINLLIGTQLVAKGWHFPKLTLVGAVDADLGLGGGDLRAGERTMQLLSQVAGRAGRTERPGKVYLQTYLPEHPVMQSLQHGDFDSFMKLEEAARRPGFWPPYGRLAAIVIISENLKQAEDYAWKLAACAPQSEGMIVLGPAPAPLSFLRGQHRYRLLLRVKRGMALQPILRDWLSREKAPKYIRVDIDVDPVSFL